MDRERLNKEIDIELQNLERISINIDGKLPKGEDWHTELLLQMGKLINGIRKAIITSDLFEKFVLPKYKSIPKLY